MQQGFFIETKDNGRIHNPYGSALLVDEHNEGFYSLTIPLEGIPTVVGDAETFDYNILTEISKGRTKGKVEVETATTDFFLTKENVYRLDQLKGKILPYMIFYGNHIGMLFNAELSYRTNDVDNGDNLKGTLTITPSSIEGDLVLDARPFVKQTLSLSGTIPQEVIFTADQSTFKYKCEVANGKSVTGKATVQGENSAKFTAKWADGELTLTNTSGAAGDVAMVEITFTDETKMGDPNAGVDKYAPYTMFVDLYVESASE